MYGIFSFSRSAFWAVGILPSWMIESSNQPQAHHEQEPGPDKEKKDEVVSYK